MEKSETKSLKCMNKYSQKSRRRQVFHELWTTNVGKVNYDKQYWREFEQRLTDEGII